MTCHTDISLGNHTAYSQYINFTSNYVYIQYTYEEWRPAPDYSYVVVNFRLENDTIDDHVVLDGGRWLEMMYERMSGGQPDDDDDLTCDDVQRYTETTASETTTNGDGISPSANHTAASAGSSIDALASSGAQCQREKQVELSQRGCGTFCALKTKSAYLRRKSFFARVFTDFGCVCVCVCVNSADRLCVFVCVCVYATGLAYTLRKHNWPLRIQCVNSSADT